METARKMPMRYQDVYPEAPLISSEENRRIRAMDILTLEFFEAEPGEMPYEIFTQHHILVNLREQPTRVENRRGGEIRDFIFAKNEIIITPAGVKSGWRWHEKSRVIVITLDPAKVETFAHCELGVILGGNQLKDVPLIPDTDITQSAIMLRDALGSKIGSEVMFESYARIFIVKLIQKYGIEPIRQAGITRGFTPRHYKRVLDHVSENFGKNIDVDSMAGTAGISTSHFSRLFKQTIGQSPHQFLMSYRVEQSKKMLADMCRPVNDIALSCGFSDQAHFSRIFKQIEGLTPKAYRGRIQPWE